MGKYVQSVSIDASVEKVFNYLARPENFPEIWPNMVEISNVVDLPNGGTQFDYVYRMVGFNIKGTSEDTDFIKNEKIASISKVGIESTIIWTFESKENETIFTYEMEYKVPVPVLGKFAEKFIVKQSENELNTFLQNLKARMEI